MFNYDFIAKENVGYLKTYKYQGNDKSLLYKYFFSPIADYCLAFTPTSIAPNTLSLLGLACIILPHFLFLFVMGNNDFSGDVPIWLLWTTAALHMIYMNFDNLDGKQARRTNNSSPLGMILDHNFDSMIILIQGTNLTTAMQFGNTIYSFYLYSIPSVVFYIITHEEYYTHQMNLPEFNAAVEGTFSIACIFAITAIYGCGMWLEEVQLLNGTQVKFVCMWIFFISALGSLPPVFAKICRHISFRNLLLQFRYMACCYGAVAYAIYFSPTDVGKTHMRSFLYLIGFTLSKGVGVVALSHVSRQNLPEYQNSIYMFVVLWLNTVSGQLLGKCVIDEGTLLAGFATLAIFIHLHFLYNMARQISEVLNIKIFQINKN